MITIVDRSVMGMDDPVYRKYRDVWENVPRGQSRQFDTASKTLLCSLVGLRKFGYREDKYGDMASVTSVVAIEKENGECAHIAAFSLKGEKYWAIGSKHVHLCCRVGCNKDLEAFEPFQRFTYASRIAKLWNSTVRKRGDAFADQLHSILCAKQWTLCCEAIFSDSQHIVDYNAVNELRFFAIAQDTPLSAGLCIVPEAAQEFFVRMELAHAPFSKRMPFPSEEFTAYLGEVARRTNSEGVVVYGSNKDGLVTTMWKEKSYPYVMERIAREAIKRGTAGKKLMGYLLGRLASQSKELRAYFTEWEQKRLPWLVDFASWLHWSCNFNAKDSWAMSTQWLTLQREFSMVPVEKLEEIRNYQVGEVAASVSAQVIMMIGPPGSGKSTLARILYILLQKAGQSPHWLNQDESGGRPQYLGNIKGALSKDAHVSHLILDKVNLDPRNRSDYMELGLDPSVTVIFGHPEGDEEFQRVCVERVVGRGDRHRTLKVSSPEDQAERAKVSKLIKDMVDSYVPPDDKTGCVFLDVEGKVEDNVALVWQAMTNASTKEQHPVLNKEAIAEALQLNKEYEDILATHPRPRFCGVSIADADLLVDSVCSVVPPGVMQGKELNKAFHITTKYFGGEVDPAFLIEAIKLEGKKIPIKLVKVAYNSSGVAVAVQGDFRCTNAVPHITMALSPGTPPVYSNTLFELVAAGDRSVGVVDVDLVLEGVFVVQS